MLEFLLVIAAWRRGWKGWALVPSLVGYSLLFLFGGMSDGSDVSGLMILVIVGVLGALSFMIARPRAVDAPSSSTSTSLPADSAR